MVVVELEVEIEVDIAVGVVIEAVDAVVVVEASPRTVTLSSLYVVVEVASD